MEQRILQYRRYMDALLGRDEEPVWEEILSDHLQQILFFQHERLIHLIVTVVFALLEMMAVMLTLLAFTPALVLLDFMLLVLLVPYIRHYFILENEVQKMYGQYDRIREKCGLGGWKKQEI